MGNWKEGDTEKWENYKTSLSNKLQDWEAQMEEGGQEDLEKAYNQWVAAVKSFLEEEIWRKSS